MATDVSIRVGVDGEKEFRSALNGINSQIKNLNSEMKTIVSSMSGMDDAEENTAKQTDVLGRSMDAAKQKISLLSAEYNRQKAALSQLEDALSRAEQEFGANSVQATKAQNAYNRQAKAVNDLGTQLNNATADLNRMEKEMRDIESGAAQAGDALDDLGDDASQAGSSLRDAFTGGAIAGGIQALISGISGLVDQTSEYRKIMGTLEVSSQKAGYSAEETAASYQQLYGVIGDDQQSATALANLQALGVSQEQLTQFVDGAIGAWATYGDSIPIDSLAEAINETAQAGTVTGAFADVLNWAGTSEDEFNEKLAACGTESERANLILQELQKQGLMGAADAWRENNAAIVESNEAQLAMNDSLASISETLSPLISMLTEGLAAVLAVIQPAIQFFVDNAPVIIAAIAGIAAGIAAMNISAIIGKIAAIGPAIAGVVSAIGGPVTLIVAAIAGIAAAIVALWNTNEGFRNAVTSIWEGIKSVFSAAWQFIQSVWSAAGPFFQGIWSGIQSTFGSVQSFFSGIFSAAWNAVQSVWSAATGFFQGIWNAIQSAFSVAAGFFSSVFSAAWSAVQGIWSVAISFFQGIWNGIQAVFAVVQAVLSGDFQGAFDAVKNIWNGAKSFFSGIWESIKGVFSNAFSAFSDIGQSIVDGIKSGISNGWNALTGWVRDKAMSLLNSAKSALGIHSPSKVFRDEIGKMIPEGMALGIADGEKYPARAVNNMIETALSSGRAIASRMAAPFYTDSRGVGAAGMDGAGGTVSTQPIQVTVPVDLSIDSAVIARKTYTAYVREGTLRGQSAVRSSRNGG